MRNLLLGFGLLLAMVMPAVAAPPVFDDPAGLVAYAYQGYLGDAGRIDPAELYSPSLLMLFAADAERTPDGEMGALGFDPFINGQDYQIDAFSIADAAIDGDQAVVVVADAGEVVRPDLDRGRLGHGREDRGRPGRSPQPLEGEPKASPGPEPKASPGPERPIGDEGANESGPVRPGSSEPPGEDQPWPRPGPTADAARGRGRWGCPRGGPRRPRVRRARAGSRSPRRAPRPRSGPRG